MVLPPEGATPSSPASGELVAWIASPYRGLVHVYADGRLIWPFREPHLGQQLPEGVGPLEQRLTPEGVALVQAEILSTGLFDPDRRPPGSEPGFFGRGNVQVRNGDRLVLLQGKEEDEEELPWMPELDRLLQRLAEWDSWLPVSAWEDREIRAYVPSRYAICPRPSPRGPDEPAGILPLLPASAQDLLADARIWRAEDFACFVVQTEEARAVAKALDDARSPEGAFHFGRWFTALPRRSP